MFCTFRNTGFPFAKAADLCDFARLFFPRKTMAYAIIRTVAAVSRRWSDTLDVDLLDVTGAKLHLW